MGCIQKNAKIFSFLAFVIGAALLAVGCSVKWVVFPNILNDQVRDNLKLENGTQAFDAFLSPPVPIHMDFHFLEVTNPDDVQVNGSKPVLKESGPWVYREIREKHDVKNGGADTIYYNEYRMYAFDAEATEAAGCHNCKANDTVSILNPVMALINGVWPQLEALDEIKIGNIVIDGLEMTLLKSVLSGSIDDCIVESKSHPNDGLIMTKPVDDILYKGVDTTVTDCLWNEKIPDIFKFVNSTLPGKLPFKSVQEIYDLINDQFPQLSDGKFGIFKGRNDTEANMFYRVNNGANNIKDYLKILEFNGEASLPDNWWPNIAATPSQTEMGGRGVCHDIMGTDGTMFAPGIDKTKKLWIFVSDLCRSMWLEHDTDDTVMGIDIQRFRAPKKVFQMSNPDNFCYCQNFDDCAIANKTTDTYDNSPCKKDGCVDGLIQVGPCLGGAPISMSSPHFYNGDKDLVDAFVGLSPDKSKHDTVLDIEPITGLAVNAAKRIQVNMPLSQMEDFEIFKNLGQNFTAFPVLWANENAKIDDVNADKFKSQVSKPIALVNGLSYGFGIALGAVFIVMSWVLIFFCVKTNRNEWA